MPFTLNYDTAVANIKASYYASLQFPTLYKAGIEWYFAAHELLQDMAARQRVSSDVAVGVTAVLSPNNKWLRNTVDAENCIRVAAAGGNEHDVKCCTYGENKTKAFRIATGEPYNNVLGGNKVWSFFWNLVHPEDAVTVTVDGHAVAIALGARIPLSKSPQLSKKQYDLIASAYRQAAAEINADRLTGDTILPSQVQAVCWVYYRFLHKLS